MSKNEEVGFASALRADGQQGESVPTWEIQGFIENKVFDGRAVWSSGRYDVEGALAYARQTLSAPEVGEMVLIRSGPHVETADGGIGPWRLVDAAELDQRDERIRRQTLRSVLDAIPRDSEAIVGWLRSHGLGLSPGAGAVLSWLRYDIAALFPDEAPAAPGTAGGGQPNGSDLGSVETEKGNTE